MSDTKFIKPSYKVHPAIGVARLGNSPNAFYLSPETTGGLPIECDADGNAIVVDGKEQTVSSFKDDNECIKRQAARFRIYTYDTDAPHGRELKIGDTVYGKGTSGALIDIQWTVYLANKKSVWYEFLQSQGEHGYEDKHPLRNAEITNTQLRQQLIIDPGPQSVSGFEAQGPQSAQLDRNNPNYATTFPPPLQPKSIDSLGDLKTTVTPDQHIRLLVLGGFGNSGSMNSGFGEPHIDTYANNDGWFDDTSDGPVTATLIYQDVADNMVKTVQIDESGWVVVGYPRFAPELVDMITIDDLTYDLFVRQFGYNPSLYGPGPYNSAEPINCDDAALLLKWRRAQKQYNPEYYPYFYRDIWPILERPYYMQYVTNVLGISHQAHETTQYGGDFYQPWMATTPKKQPNQPDDDPYKTRRAYVYAMLRLPGEENQLFNHHVPEGTSMYNRELMPLLAGDNPINNVLPSKFLRLTDTQLFMLKQWAAGKFINEKEEDIEAPPLSAAALDRGVLGNVLGGAFNPGAEMAWIIRNPAIFSKPYRINPDYNYIRNYVDPNGAFKSIVNMPPLSVKGNLSTGLQPGDLTKYSALPWQSDFNECSSQTIDVTYELWNKLYPDSTGDTLLESMQKDTNVLWWPVHRPMQVYQQIAKPPTPDTHEVGYSYPQVDWARGIPQTKVGDLKMVTEWANLGFVVRNTSDPAGPPFVESEYSGDL